MTAQREVTVCHSPGLDGFVEAFAVCAAKALQLFSLGLLPHNFSVFIACTSICGQEVADRKSIMDTTAWQQFARFPFICSRSAGQMKAALTY